MLRYHLRPCRRLPPRRDLPVRGEVHGPACGGRHPMRRRGSCNLRRHLQVRGVLWEHTVQRDHMPCPEPDLPEECVQPGGLLAGCEARWGALLRRRLGHPQGSVCRREVRRHDAL